MRSVGSHPIASVKRLHGQVFFNVQPAEQYGRCFVEFVWGQLFEYGEQFHF
jgi:hypothetical protein